jgi:hypothetical protein
MHADEEELIAGASILLNGLEQTPTKLVRISVQIYRYRDAR